MNKTRQQMRGRSMPDHLKGAARRLRKNMTEAEKLLWSRLRAHRFAGASFRRQAVLGPYVVDFLCAKTKIVVEIDGSQHATSNSDATRDAYLAAHGYRVVRYWNNEVLGNPDAVLKDLHMQLSDPTRTPSPGPSPQRGEGGPGGTGNPQPLRYERDPREIYRQSFATVRAEVRLDHLPADLHEVAIRLVHSCGMTDVPDRLAWSDDLATSARAALAAGAPILCDCEMVASGIVCPRPPAANPVICTLNDPATPELATAIGNTRSAAAVELWRDRIEGSITVIGNAPTALFHLLELLDQGWPLPAAIIGMPVGFVGAAEAKAELAANPRGVPFLTLRGRRGGSAMASAVVNALAAGLEAPQ
jgi:precorrin-8X/cobalt-precorrin-8 methylmutase